MCRLVVSIGPARTLASLVLEPEHSLLRQSYAPRHQDPGVINADGFGVGWYAPDLRPEPAVYRTTLPLWNDTVFASMAGAIESLAILAAVRAATPGFPIDLPSTQPFASGPWLFAHNGSVYGFRDGVGEELRRGVSVRRASAIDSGVDSAVLFAMALDRLDAGMPPPDALADVVSVVKQASGGKLNLALTDGTHLAATTYGNSLFTREGDGLLVASEPLDDDARWRQVLDLSVLAADAAGSRIEPL